MIDNFKRVLGLTSCLAAALGIIVAQSTVTSVLYGFGVAGHGFVLAMIGAWILVFCTNLTFSELSMMLPRAGGLSSYAEIAMGHFPAMIAVISGYLIVSVLAVPAEITLFCMVFNHLLPGVAPPFWLGFLVLASLVILNLAGLDLFARFQTAFTAIMIVTLVGLGAWGLLHAGHSTTPSGPLNPMGIAVFSLIPLAIWAFMGGEFVCSLVEETQNPQRNIPLSMFLAILLALAVYFIFGAGAGAHLSQAQLQSELPHVIAAETIMGKMGLLWIGLAGIAATASSINSVLATAPRLLYGMAHAGQAPAIFKRLHSKFRTPHVALFFLGAVMIGPLFWSISKEEKVLLLLISASCSWLVAYLIAHVCVIVLRIRQPKLARPFKTPIYPLPQLVGIIGIIYVLLNVSPEPHMAEQVYFWAGFLMLATILYSAFWVRYVMKKPLFEPVPFEEAMNE